MKKAAISEIKVSLSEYLAKVKKGEEIIVTERGHPVAKIIPFRVEGLEKEQRLELARQGILELGKGNVSDLFLNPSPIADPSGSVAKALTEERESQI